MFESYQGTFEHDLFFFFSHLQSFSRWGFAEPLRRFESMTMIAMIFGMEKIFRILEVILKLFPGSELRLIFS